MAADLTYSNDGMFTRFYPETPAGEEAWRTMAQGGAAAFLPFQIPGILSQLRAAGYKVSKARVVKMSGRETDDLAAELCS